MSMAQQVLNIHSLSKEFASKKLFTKLNLGLEEGERLAILGPNGSGKSTLLKIVTGLEKADSGDCSLRNTVRMAYLGQNPGFPKDKNVYDVAMECLKHLDSETAMLNSSKYLSQLGFEDFSVLTGNLSGGWQKKLAIAICLAEEADLIIMDEPTNHLDMESIIWLENYLKSKKPTLIFISHDRYFIQNVATRVYEINPIFSDGFYTVKGSYDQYLEKRADMISGQESQREVLKNKWQNELEWLRRGPKARTTKSNARIKDAYDIKMKLDTVDNRLRSSKLSIQFTETGRQANKLIEFKNVNKVFGEKTILKNLNLLIRPGECLGLVGNNGVGKSSIFNLIMDKITPDSGSVERAENLKVQYFDQIKESLDLEKTVKENLNPDGDFIDLNGKMEHIAGYLSKFSFDAHFHNRKLSSLSGGERARLLLAKLMLEPADIILLDEPTNDLDIDTLQVMEDNLQDLSAGIVLISHDRFFLDKLSDRILFLRGEGEYQFYADWSQCIESEKIKKSTEKVDNKSESKKKESKVKKKKLSYNEQREFNQLEDKILLAESALEEWKAKVDDPKVQVKPIELKEAFENMKDAQDLVDKLYERWAELGEIANN